MFPRDLNKIDDLMQDITEQQDIAQEISEAFSQRVQFADGFDEVGAILKNVALWLFSRAASYHIWQTMFIA